MADGPDGEEQDLPAGGFTSWLAGVQAAIRGEHGSDVPCNGCTACCTSSRFVDIAPDETDTLSHIPADLLFPAPRRPSGHVVLGYDEKGHCPMLVDGTCSIYEHRPRACRTYDCRVLAAAGLPATGDGVLRRARRWRFDFPSLADVVEHGAVRAAASFLDEHPDVVREASIPTNGTQLAVLAITIHDLFIGRVPGTAEVARTIRQRAATGGSR